MLIVDDNADAAATLGMLLEMDGHDVRIAADGRSALEAFEGTQPEVVILDIGLPDIDGYEVARRMRASIKGKSVLLLAVTGWGQVDDKRKALEAGFDQHLTKPIDSDYLSQLLTERRRT